MAVKHLSLFVSSIAMLLAALTATHAQSYSDQPPSRDAATENSAGNSLPDDFKGKVTYTGHYEGMFFFPGRRPAGLGIPTFNPARTRNVSGNYQIAVEFDGTAIQGSVQTTGGLRAEPFRGRRDGDTCHIMFGAGELTAHCDKASLSGGYDSTNSEGQRIQFQVDTRESQFVDYAQVAAQRAREQADAERRLAAAEARLANDPLARKLDGIIRQDSQSWLMWRYDIASVSDVHEKREKGADILTGHYTFNGGSPGTVLVKLSGDSVRCLQFWNETACRPLGRPQSRDNMARIIGSMLSGGGGSGGSTGSTCDANCQSVRAGAAQQQRNIEQTGNINGN
ncbi:MAG: hypothetical protein WDM86_12760 [Rhizomicrobium sp.]